MIDLRSDTVTKPGPTMRAVMAKAEVGDDVFGDDPTVNRLEELAADLLGTEAAIFVSSGTQSNLIGVMSHCRRGDEYIVGQEAHTYKFEAGGAAVLGSIQPQPLDFEPDGTLDLNKVAKAIKPDDDHFARTRLLCLENTQNARVIPLDYLKKATAFARDHNLKIHLDGARIFNAAVKSNIDVKEISTLFDSASICLSKGLGAPIGSLLCADKTLVKEAHKWRKMLGGGMRQVGIIAAAGIYALQNNVNRLAEDHENAFLLAKGLAEIDKLDIDPGTVQTNMVFLSIDNATGIQLKEYLRERDISIYVMGNTIRLVTHLDISKEDVYTFINAIKGFFL